MNSIHLYLCRSICINFILKWMTAGINDMKEDCYFAGFFCLFFFVSLSVPLVLLFEMYFLFYFWSLAFHVVLVLTWPTGNRKTVFLFSIPIRFNSIFRSFRNCFPLYSLLWIISNIPHSVCVCVFFTGFPVVNSFWYQRMKGTIGEWKRKKKKIFVERK